MTNYTIYTINIYLIKIYKLNINLYIIIYEKSIFYFYDIKHIFNIIIMN